jgi:hypothetical protein
MAGRKWWIAAGLTAVVLASGLIWRAAEATNGEPPAAAGPLKRAYWRALGIRSTQMQIRVMDATTMKGIPGAGCVVAETGDRVETNEKGVAPVIEVPVFRHPRLDEILAELHGALTLLCYKNGYRDAVAVGARTYENTRAEPEVWMYPAGPDDRRVEPTLHTFEAHRVWKIQLADKFRLREEGEGPERPQLTNPKAGVAPQTTIGGGVQTAPFRGPTGQTRPGQQ